jgi:uncharacterized protein DUF481
MAILRTGTMALFLLCGWIGVSHAQDTTWAPPTPGQGKFDWIQLVSGEWLGGELKAMRDGSLEFDSDKLDLLKLDWSDVKGLRSPRSLEYVFDDRRTAVGPAVMSGGTIGVGTGGEQYPASQLLSIVPGATSEWDRWSGKFSLGIVVRSGNTNQRDYNSILSLRRETGRTRFDVNGSVNYGTLESEKNIDNRQADAQLDVFLTKRLYVIPIAASAYADEFQNIDLRSTVSAGFGYDVVDKAKVDWTVGISVVSLPPNYSSVEAGESDVVEAGTVIPTTLLEWDPNGDIETSLDYRLTVNTETIKDAYHHMVALVDVDLTTLLDLAFSATWDHAETPRRDENGDLPKRDDLRISFGLGLDF